jgi:hypothetical protein
MSPFVDKNDDSEGENHADDRVHAERKTSSFENTTNGPDSSGAKAPVVAGSILSDLRVRLPKEKAKPRKRTDLKVGHYNTPAG